MACLTQGVGDLLVAGQLTHKCIVPFHILYSVEGGMALVGGNIAQHAAALPGPRIIYAAPDSCSMRTSSVRAAVAAAGAAALQRMFSPSSSRRPTQGRQRAPCSMGALRCALARARILRPVAQQRRRVVDFTKLQLYSKTVCMQSDLVTAHCAHAATLLA